MRRDNGFALVEMVICIAVLALVSMFVVRMFVTAANTENKAQDLDIASTLAQTCAERYKQSGEGAVTQYYDRNWQLMAAETDDEQGFMLYTEEITTGGGLPGIRITVKKLSPYLLQDTPPVIFKLDVARRTLLAGYSVLGGAL